MSIAEDVLQEVFLALVRAPERFDPSRGTVRAFLLAIARNQVRKRWEKERRWETLDDYAFEAAPMDPLAGEVVDLVARAVQSLPPVQREALVLFEYEGLLLEEVAQADSVAGWALTNPMIYAWSCARLSDAGAETVIRRYPHCIIVGSTPTAIQKNFPTHSRAPRKIR